jgi:hypothetical protein
VHVAAVRCSIPDEAEHLRVEPIVQALCRLAAEENGLFCGLDKRKDDIFILSVI